MSLKGKTLLKGHTLRHEGQPFDRNGNLRHLHGGIGAAKCSCGALSPTLSSNYARKRWHREHKDEIREATAETQGVPCGGPAPPQTFHYGPSPDCPECGPEWLREQLGIPLSTGEEGRDE